MVSFVLAYQTLKFNNFDQDDFLQGFGMAAQHVTSSGSAVGSQMVPSGLGMAATTLAAKVSPAVI